MYSGAFRIQDVSLSIHDVKVVLRINIGWRTDESEAKRTRSLEGGRNRKEGRVRFGFQFLGGDCDQVVAAMSLKVPKSNNLQLFKDGYKVLLTLLIPTPT